MSWIFFGGFWKKNQDPQKNPDKSILAEAIFFLWKKMKFRNQKYFFDSRSVGSYGGSVMDKNILWMKKYFMDKKIFYGYKIVRAKRAKNFVDICMDFFLCEIEFTL